LKPGLLQEPIQYAPCEGTMRAAALEREVHKDRRAGGLPLTSCGHGDLIDCNEQLTRCERQRRRRLRCNFHAIRRADEAKMRPAERGGAAFRDEGAFLFVMI
jgi:hypothetical protein